MTKQGYDNHMIRGYNDMMHAIRDVLDMADSQTSVMSLQQALEKAVEQVTATAEISNAQALQISEYIKRDINDAAEYLMESSSEFSDWLRLDIEIVERKIIDLFLSVADSTRTELEQIKQASTEQARYRTGEIVSPGTLECLRCQQHSTYLATSVIFRCPECGHDEFKRPRMKRLPE